MAKFAQYAMAATEEALQDANWKPEPFEQREVTVCSLSTCKLIEYSYGDRVSVLALALAISMKCTIPLWHMRKE
jgi:3-oxoacyl-(acyl-carrier-protein) synthase